MKIKEQTNPSEYELFKEILSRHPEFLEKFCIENDASEQVIDIAKNKSVKRTEAEDDDTSSKLMDNLKINLMDDGIESTNFITGKIFASYIFRKIEIAYVSRILQSSLLLHGKRTLSATRSCQNMENGWDIG